MSCSKFNLIFQKWLKFYVTFLCWTVKISGFSLLEREGITEEIVESSGKTGIIINSQLSSLAAVIRLDSKRASVWDAKKDEQYHFMTLKLCCSKRRRKSTRPNWMEDDEISLNHARLRPIVSAFSRRPEHRRSNAQRRKAKKTRRSKKQFRTTNKNSIKQILITSKESEYKSEEDVCWCMAGLARRKQGKNSLSRNNDTQYKQKEKSAQLKRLKRKTFPPLAKFNLPCASGSWRKRRKKWNPISDDDEKQMKSKKLFNQCYGIIFLFHSLYYSSWAKLSSVCWLPPTCPSSLSISSFFSSSDFI